jgi:hypothetical protein
MWTNKLNKILAELVEENMFDFEAVSEQIRSLQRCVAVTSVENAFKTARSPTHVFVAARWIQKCSLHMLAELNSRF